MELVVLLRPVRAVEEGVVRAVAVDAVEGQRAVGDLARRLGGLAHGPLALVLEPPRVVLAAVEAPVVERVVGLLLPARGRGGLGVGGGLVPRLRARRHDGQQLVVALELLPELVGDGRRVVVRAVLGEVVPAVGADLVAEAAAEVLRRAGLALGLRLAAPLVVEVAQVELLLELLRRQVHEDVGRDVLDEHGLLLRQLRPLRVLLLRCHGPQRSASSRGKDQRLRSRQRVCRQDDDRTTRAAPTSIRIGRRTLWPSTVSRRSPPPVAPPGPPETTGDDVRLQQVGQIHGRRLGQRQREREPL